MTLPKSRIAASLVNPRKMILFGLPKCGKTAILSHLDDCLIIDVEDGSRFYDAMAVHAKNLNELKTIEEELKEEMKKTGKKPYKYIAIDTISTLNEMVLPFAKHLYKLTPMGKNFNGDDVRKLPNGSGYMYTREAFKKVLASFMPYCDNLIYTAHVREKMLEKQGNEFSSVEVDIEGKLRTMIPANVDTIGYVYRKENKTIISFISSEQVVCGSRCKHLKNIEIVIAESDESKEIVKTHWDKIYI